MFALEVLTKARLADVVVLSQKNRQPDDNPGAKLSVELDLSNHTLSYFDAALKGFLYMKNGEGPKQKQATLEGVEPVSDMPDLTAIGRKIGTMHWEHEGTGYELTIDQGLGKRGSNLEISDCVLSNWRLSFKEGGSYTAKFDIESPDVSETAFGKLAKLKSREIQILLAPPTIAQKSIDDEDDDDSAVAPAPAKPRKPAAAERAAVAKVKGGKAPAPAMKYRDPATGSTWSGRGLTPKWLTVALAKGKTLADFDGSKKATLSAEAAWPFPTGNRPEAPPQSVTVERSQPGTRTARGRDATKAFINAHGRAKS